MEKSIHTVEEFQEGVKEELPTQKEVLTIQQDVGQAVDAVYSAEEESPFLCHIFSEPLPLLTLEDAALSEYLEEVCVPGYEETLVIIQRNRKEGRMQGGEYKEALEALFAQGRLEIQHIGTIESLLDLYMSTTIAEGVINIEELQSFFLFLLQEHPVSQEKALYLWEGLKKRIKVLSDVVHFLGSDDTSSMELTSFNEQMYWGMVIDPEQHKNLFQHLEEATGATLQGPIRIELYPVGLVLYPTDPNDAYQLAASEHLAPEDIPSLTEEEIRRQLSGSAGYLRKKNLTGMFTDGVVVNNALLYEFSDEKKRYISDHEAFHMYHHLFNNVNDDPDKRLSFPMVLWHMQSELLAHLSSFYYDSTEHDSTAVMLQFLKSRFVAGGSYDYIGHLGDRLLQSLVDDDVSEESVEDTRQYLDAKKKVSEVYVARGIEVIEKLLREGRSVKEVQHSLSHIPLMQWGRAVQGV